MGLGIVLFAFSLVVVTHAVRVLKKKRDPKTGMSPINQLCDSTSFLGSEYRSSKGSQQLS